MISIRKLELEKEFKERSCFLMRCSNGIESPEVCLVVPSWHIRRADSIGNPLNTSFDSRDKWAMPRDYTENETFGFRSVEKSV